MTKAPLVSIVLINWRGWRDTVDCLESLLRLTYGQYGVVVVDNDSGDESLAEIEGWAKRRGVPLRKYRQDSPREPLTLVSAATPLPQGFRCLDLIAASSNTGFCIGNNTGIEHGAGQGAEFHIVLNNDTVCEPGFLEPLVQAARQDPGVGLLSPLICYEDDRERIWFGGGKFSRALVPSYALQGEARSEVGGEPPRDSDWASGCATCIPASTFARFGGFDESFFIWCDEWDLSLRVRGAGMKIKVVPQSVIYHKVGRSLGIVSPLTFYYGTRNMLKLRARYLGTAMWLASAAATVPWKLLQAVRYALQKRDVSYLLAWWDILRDRPGRGQGIWKRQRV